MASPKYNSRRPPAPQKKPRHRGASPMPHGEKQGVPGWVWLAAGVAIGLFVAFIVKLSHAPQPATATAAGNKAADMVSKPLPVSSQSSVPAPAAVNAAKPGKPEKPADAASGDGKAVTKFDFYTLLPEREVIVPNDRAARQAAEQARAAAAAPGTTAAAAAAASDSTGPLFLQAGSFRSDQEAERRRGQLRALGIDAHVEKVGANADTWYRVQAGPFTSLDKLDKARDQLSAAGIETLLLRQK